MSGRSPTRSASKRTIETSTEQNVPTSPYRVGNWTVTRLKEELKQRNLNLVGRKIDLIERLEQADRTPLTAAQQSNVGKMGGSTLRRGIRSEGEDSELDEAVMQRAIAKMTVAQLQDELMRRGLSPVGKKDELLARLAADNISFPPKSSPSKRVSPPRSTRRSSRSPVRTLSPSKARSSPTRESKRPSPRRSSINVFLSPQTPGELCLFRQPFETLKHFSLASCETFNVMLGCLSDEPMKVVSLITLVVLVVLIDRLEGIHQKPWREAKELVGWLFLWFIRGFLSCLSIGAQANSFPMYLGPFVAQVTTTAFFCKGLNFLLHGKDSFKCNQAAKKVATIAIGSIFAKMVWPVIFYGAGLILGQFPLFYLATMAGNALEAIGKGRPFSFNTFENLSYRAKYLLFLLTTFVIFLLSLIYYVDAESTL